MKTQRRTRRGKLTLHRETLRHLETAELASIRGGTASLLEDCSEAACPHPDTGCNRTLCLACN